MANRKNPSTKKNWTSHRSWKISSTMKMRANRFQRLNQYPPRIANRSPSSGNSTSSNKIPTNNRRRNVSVWSIEVRERATEGEGLMISRLSSLDTYKAMEDTKGDFDVFGFDGWVNRIYSCTPSFASSSSCCCSCSFVFFFCVVYLDILLTVFASWFFKQLIFLSWDWDCERERDRIHPKAKANRLSSSSRTFFFLAVYLYMCISVYQL